MFNVIFWSFVVISVFCAARYGYVAATASDGPQKGRARLIAGWAFCSWFSLFPALAIVHRAFLPAYEFQGTITSVDVRGRGRDYSAYLTIVTTQGGSIRVHVDNSDRLWRIGQRLRIRYYGEIGELIQATFIDENGNEQGQANGTAIVGEIFSIGIGILLAFAVWWRYRRDPHGRIENPHELSGQYGSVDEESLLHLSRTSKE